MSGVSADAKSIRENAIAEYGGDIVKVCVATEDIEAGSSLSESNVKLMEWASDLLPEGCFTKLEDIDGKTLAFPVLNNEPISQKKIGEVKDGLEVPEGLCAVSISSEEVQAVGGAVKPGTLVNLYTNNASRTRLIGKEILVLETSNSATAAGANSSMFGNSKSDKSISWITLAVSESSVEELIHASKSGGLYMALPARKEKENE
jgi:pilus assembly protein CpaB